MSTNEFISRCREMLTTFFNEFPDDAHQDIAWRVLKKLSEKHRDYDGAPGGWAGGIVYSSTKYSLLDHPAVLNAEMEAVFGVSMGTIRKRAEELWETVYAAIVDRWHDKSRPGAACV